MEKPIYVGLGECKVSADPNAVMTALGLGSCVAVIFWCPVAKVGGMVHVVLPSSDGKPVLIRGKYADTALPYCLDEMLKKGGVKGRIVVKLAGGAEVFRYQVSPRSIGIGKKNLEACTRILRKLGLRIRSQAVGGGKGRTVKLFIRDGRVLVKSMEGELEI